MKILTVNENNQEIERNETRQEIVARHNRMRQWSYTDAVKFLDSIHSEEPHFQNLKAENDRANREEMARQVDMGLTTEINTSQDLVNLNDTIENCREILRRHPYGFKDGDAEGAEVLGIESVALTPEKPARVNPYLNKSPKMVKGKLVWVEDSKQTA